MVTAHKSEQSISVTTLHSPSLVNPTCIQRFFSNGLKIASASISFPDMAVDNQMVNTSSWTHYIVTVSLYIYTHHKWSNTISPHMTLENWGTLLVLISLLRSTAVLYFSFGHGDYLWLSNTQTNNIYHTHCSPLPSQQFQSLVLSWPGLCSTWAIY